MKKVLTSLFLSVSLASVSAHAFDVGQADISDSVGISHKQMRDGFLNHLHSNYKVSQDSLLLDYVRELGEHIISSNTLSGDFQFLVIDDDSINAFAGPTGVIAVNTGLIEFAENDHEVAAVIAHEIAHVRQAHLSRGFENNKATVGDALAIGGTLLVGAINPEAGMAGYTAYSAKKIQDSLSQSRSFEHEADHIGIQLMMKAGYNPFAMASFFDKLRKKYGNQEESLEFLMTHPVTETRLSNALDRASASDKFTKEISGAKSYLVKKQVETDIERLKLAYELSPSNLRPLMGVSEALLKSNDVTGAIDYLSKNVENIEHKWVVYKKLARLHNLKSDFAGAYYYEALSSYEKGDIQRYKSLLKTAKKQEKMQYSFPR